jgi:hypothetical protein
MAASLLRAGIDRQGTPLPTSSSDWLRYKPVTQEEP